MALNPSVCGAAIASAIKAIRPDPTAPVSDAQLTAIWTATCTEIFNHIKANAVVTVPAAGINAPNGPCSGSATGTVSA